MTVSNSTKILCYTVPTYLKVSSIKGVYLVYWYYRLAALDGRGSGRGQEAGGRMRRFRQEDYRDDSDDDKKQTYNGNSTQQQ